MAKSNLHHVEDQINDLTECPICTETLSEPKVILCLHTFCLKCLEKYCLGNEAGKSMSCPLCRNEFIIPEGGLSKLKTNFFVEKLIEAGNHLKTLSLSKKDQCNCSSGQDLVIYCEDCKVAACYRCKLKSHHSHHSTDYAVYTSPKRKQQIFADVNKVKNMLANVSFQSMEFDEKTQNFVINVRETKDKILARCTYLKDRIEDQTRKLLEELRMLETTELEKAEQVKKHHETIIDKFHNFLQMSRCLVDENNEPNSLIQLAEDLQSQTEDLISQFESFKLGKQMNFLNVAFEECVNTSTMGKIYVHGRNTLEEKEADDDLKSHSFKTSSTPCQLKPIQPSFSADAVSKPNLPPEFGTQQKESENDSNINHDQSLSEPLPRASPNYFQSVLDDLLDEPLDEPVDEPLDELVWENSSSSEYYANSLTASPGDEFRICDKIVTGLVALGKNLYIAFEDSNEIDVYDNSVFTYIRSLTVKPLRDPYDITGYGNSLYISERDDPKIYKFRLAQKTTSTLTVEGCSMALSMTSEQNVLATCCEEDKSFIVEYSRFGDLVRRIDLQNDVRNPKHAIRLSNGNLVVCHGQYRDRLRRVCLIDSDGDVIKSFGGRWGRAVGDLNEPIRLVSYNDRFILVGDMRNNNLQILAEDLGFKGELVSNELVRSLKTMCVDTKNNELFIGDYDAPDSYIMSYQLRG